MFSKPGCISAACVAMVFGGTVLFSQSRRIISDPVQRSPAGFAKPQELREKWGDQGDDTYVNPILPADFSDPDVTRVDQTFYMISSTMQYSPGMVVLESFDLVNWTIVGHVVPDLSLIDSALNWDKMDRAGRGLWAGSIRFHSGKFWVYFGTPDQGIYVSTADKAAGPWSSPRLVLAEAGWDDPCSFWDDDGQGYLVATHFLPEGNSRTTYNVHLFQLSPNGFKVIAASDKVIHRSEGSEANKLYKVNKFYYHYYSEVKAEGRVPMMERSLSLGGPWQRRQLMHVHGTLDKEPNQGGLVELHSDQWYFLSHQGKGDWEGRATVLLPVRWAHGWPMIGRIGIDGMGNMLWHDQKPVGGHQPLNIALSDDFSSPELQPAWEWNYQPNAAMWSLRERPGFLRLHALPPIGTGGFKTISNVITQRSMRTSRNQFTAKLDLTGMESGQEAGITHFAKTYSSIGVVQSGSARRLSLNNNGVRTGGPAVVGNNLWLRSEWDVDGTSYFSFSFDDRSYQRWGGSYQLTWGNYRGDRMGIFTSNISGSGYLDVDQVEYQTAR